MHSARIKQEAIVGLLRKATVLNERIKNGGFFMGNHETKFCSHCRARYRTILDTCVYCSGRLRTVSDPAGTPEIFFVVINLTAILLFCFIVLK